MRETNIIEQAKIWLVDTLSLSRDALHVHVSVGLYLAVLVATRRRMGDWLPWTIVLALALAGEVVDAVLVMNDDVGFMAGRHIHDIVNTMIWPTVFTAWGRWLDSRRPGGEIEDADTAS